jgi:hypothetical protein
MAVSLDVLEYTPNGFLRAKWAALAAAEMGNSLQLNGSNSLALSLQIGGSFSGTVAVKVSNDKITWFSAKDLAGVVIAAAAGTFIEMQTSALYLAPECSAGTGTASIILVAKI